MEAMAYGCPATSAYHLDPQHGDVDDRPLRRARRSRTRFLPDLVTMDKIASYCLTEPGSGSDAAALKTTRAARRRPLCRSTAPSSSSRARATTTSMSAWSAPARRSRRASPAWSIEKDTPGLSFGAPEKKLGWNASPTAQVIFEDAACRSRTCVGAEGDGLPLRDDGARRRAAQHRRLLARRRAALPRRGDQLHQGAPAVRPADRRLPEHAVHARRHGDRPGGGARAALHRRGQGHRRRARQVALLGDGQAARDRQRLARSSTARCSCTAATAICRTIRSNASGATCASIRSWRAPTRSCA